MAERRIINGWIVERGDDGQLRTIGPANGGAPQMPADPTFQYQEPKARLDNQLTETQIRKAALDASQASATQPYDVRKAAADATKAEAEANALLAKQQRRGDANPAAKLNDIIRSIDNIAADAKDNDGWGETGWLGSWLRNRPGSAAYDLQGKIQKIDANSAFDQLQAMREASPTGGALGGVTEGELALLKSTVANLDPNMSQGEFLAQLQAARDHYSGLAAKISGQAPQPQQAQQRDEQPMAVAGNMQPPSGPDRTNPIIGSGNGAPLPGGFTPYGAKTRIEKDPARAGLNSEVLGMIKGGVSPDLINQHIQSRGGVPASPQVLQQAIAYAAQNPKWAGVDLETREVPLSGMQQFRNNAPQTMIGTAAATAANAGGFGIPQMLAGGEGLDYLRSQNPGSAFAGDVAGVIGGTSLLGKAGANVTGRLAPSLLTRGGSKGQFGRQLLTDASYGGVYGATTEGDPLTGAGTAALGSLGGNVIGKGLQKGFQGVTDPAVQYLTERGIPLTLGQTLGNRGVVGKTMNKLESLPVIGDMMGARRLDGMKAFEREALKDVVQPVGGNVTEGGTQGLVQAQDAVGEAYRNALSGVNVSPDAQFMTDAKAAMQAGAAVPKFGEDFTYAMNQEVGPLFGNNGTLAGPELQSALQSIGKIRSGFGKNPDAMAGYAADAAGQMDDALSGLVGRQVPDVMPAYNAAKGAFSRLAPFEKARIGAVNQEAISPAQLARAVTNNTNKFGGRAAAARGDNLTDLMRYGQEVLPSTVPNSGTADRMAGIMPFILPTALGGTAAYSGVQDSPGTAGLLATLAAMSTKTGQKAMQKALTSRPKGAKKLGGIFGSRKAQRAIGGAITAPLLIE